MRCNKNIRWAICAALLAALGGCNVTTNGDSAIAGTGETVHESNTVDLSKAKGVERVRVNLELHAGELHVDGGAKELMEAEFTYNVASWKPEVRFDRSGFRSTLSVKQGGSTATMGSTKNEWRLRLNDELPTEFSLHCGAGENRLNLGALDLRDVEVHIGAGRVELDLRGRQPKHDYSVSIHGGVGEAVVHLPADTGVVATASGGLGEIEVNGLEKQGDEWRSGASGKGKSTIRLDVHGGIGKITIDAR
jgi:hypothetical protein